MGIRHNFLSSNERSRTSNANRAVRLRSIDRARDTNEMTNPLVFLCVPAAILTIPPDYYASRFISAWYFLHPIAAARAL